MQNFLKEKLHSSFPSLREGDIKTAVMGESGEDIILSPAARDIIPYSFECKNQERLNMWSAYKQASNNSGGHEPIVFLKRNHHKPLALMDAEYFIGVLSR